MVILKFAGHGSIDPILNYALPELFIVALDDHLLARGLYAESWKGCTNLHRMPSAPSDDLGVGIGWSLQHHYGIKEIDLFIVDDVRSLHLSMQLKPKQMVWYVHGLHTNPFEDWYFRKHLQGVPLIAGSSSKLNFWREKLSPKRCYLHRPALTNSSFDISWKVAPPTKDVVFVKNDFIKTVGIYNEALALYLWKEFYREFGKRLHVYGYNNSELTCSKGGISGRIAPVVGEYKVAAFPTLNSQPSYSELEVMASGVPTVLFGTREGFPEDLNGRAFFLSKTAEEFLDNVQTLLNNPPLSCSVGKQGSQFILDNFHINKVASGIRYWFEQIIIEGTQ